MRKVVLAFVVAGLLVAASAAPAVARSTRITVAGEAVLVHIVDPGVTTQNGAVVSVRGMVRAEYGTWNTGYFTGPELNVVNYDLDTVNGTGRLWGWGRHTPTEVSGGTWFCAFADTFQNFTYSGKAGCIGMGSLRGWLLTAAMQQTPAGAGFTGVILRPQH